MNQQSYLQYVQSPGSFWRALQVWARGAIVLVGVTSGLWVWLSGLSATFPLIALISLGTTTPALVLKLLIVLGAVVSLPNVAMLATWLFFLAVYAVCRIIIQIGQQATLADFIFKKQ